MLRILPPLLAVLALLITPYAKSADQADTGEQPPAEATAQQQTENSTATQSDAPAQTQSSPPSGAASEGTPPGEEAGKEDSADKSDKNQSEEKPPQAEDLASQALKASKEEIEQKKEQEVSKDVIQQEGGGLISGKFQINLSQGYSHSDNSQLYVSGFGVLPIVVVGNVNVQRLRRDTFTTALSASYKLTNTMQVSLNVPYQYMVAHTSDAGGLRGSSVINTSNDEKTQTSELGDISASLSYAFLTETIKHPSVNLGLSIKARNGRDIFETPDPAAKPPAGTGFYSIRGTVSANKSTAPAVLFGTIGYVYNIKRNKILYTPKGKPPSVIDTYQAGPGLSFSEGIGISLNYQVSLNFSFAQSINFNSKVNGQDVANSSSTGLSFTMGGSYRLSPKTTISLSFTQALSNDAGGFSMNANIPLRF